MRDIHITIKPFSVLILILLFVVAADWSKPDLNSLKANFPAEIRAIATNAAKMDYSGDTNIPTGTLRYNRSTDLFEEYNGSTWTAQPVDLAVPNDGSITVAKLGLTDWTSWTPPLSSASGTIANLVVNKAEYLDIWGIKFFQMSLTFDLNTTASSVITFDIPSAASQLTDNIVCTAYDTSGGTPEMAIATHADTNTYNVRRANGSDWTVTTGKVLNCNGSYRGV